MDYFAVKINKRWYIIGTKPKECYIEIPSIVFEEYPDFLIFKKK